jgi:hypothetical protein
MKIRHEPSTRASRGQERHAVTAKALLVLLLCFYVILGCGPSDCPSKEVAEHIARQLIYKEYSGDLYKIDLEIKRKFMKKIKNTEYCVFEFNYNAKLRGYFLRYETLERERYKKGMQLAYIHTQEGWYGTVVQKAQ